MTIYSYGMISRVNDALLALSRPFFEKTRLHLTDDEFISAFINPEHVPTLREVEELAGFFGGVSATAPLSLPDYPGTMTVQLAFASRPPIVLPRYISGGLQPTCPPEVKAKIDAWVAERWRLGTVIGDAAEALYWLNENCGDAEAMSLVMPCFPTLLGRVDMSEDNRTTKRARKLTNVKRFGALPAMPREAKARIAEVSAVVNSLTLTLEAPEQTVPLRHCLVGQYGYTLAEPRKSFLPRGGTSIAY